MLEQAPGRNCGRWRKAHAGGGHPAGTAAHRGTMLDQSIPEGLYITERPTLVQFLKNCSPWEGSMSEEFVKDCTLWKRPHAGAGEKHEEEGAAEKVL